MATIEIENAKVTRIIEGYGFEVKETRMVKGEEYGSWYTVWNKEVKPQVGDTVTVQGQYSLKVDEYEGKTRYQISVNNAEVMLADGADAPF